MTSDLLILSASFALAATSTVLILAFVMLNKSLVAMLEILRRLQGDLQPVVGNLSTISVNLAAASDGLKGSMQQLGRLSEAVGNIGDDLEQGRRAVKGGAEILGALAGLASPWLSKLKLFRGK